MGAKVRARARIENSSMAVTASEELPPAASTSKLKGAPSKASLSLAGAVSPGQR